MLPVVDDELELPLVVVDESPSVESPVRPEELVVVELDVELDVDDDVDDVDVEPEGIHPLNGARLMNPFPVKLFPIK